MATNAGTAVVVGEHADLARAGEHVDAHVAHDELLGGGDVRVARTDDLVDRAGWSRYRTRAPRWPERRRPCRSRRLPPQRPRRACRGSRCRPLPAARPSRSRRRPRHARESRSSARSTDSRRARRARRCPRAAEGVTFWPRKMPPSCAVNHDCVTWRWWKSAIAPAADAMASRNSVSPRPRRPRSHHR
jgi:hypothetical protein